MYPKGSAALALAREGLRVFRLPEDSNDREVKELKKPFSYYTKEATHDPDKIKSWWRQGNYNIGVFLTGTDFFAVDYDMDPGEDGEQAFKLHEATWPKTRIARTQSGGYHRYYKLPPGWYVRSQQTFGDFKNVQIKGNGTNCYVVGPGSTIHGRKYEWINPDQEFTEVDDEFIQQFEETNKPELRKKANSTPLCEPDTPEILAAVAQYITGDAPVAHQGNRDNTAYKVACQVKNYGASPETALNALFEWNGTKCNPPLDSDVIETKVDSAYKNSQRPQGDDAPSVRLERAREEFDVVSLPGDEGRAPSRDDDFGDPIDLWAEEQTPPDLPPGLLPPALEDFVTDEAERKGVERGAVALAALVACAAAAPAGFEVQVKQHDTGHKDRAILWGMLVGPPGTRKSPVLNEVIQPLEEIEEKWRREDEPTWRTYRAAHAQWEKTGRKNGEPEPKQPRRRRKAVNDTTTEALAPILSDNPDGVISYRDELSGWVGDMDAYRPGKAASKDQAFWLSAKQGKGYTVDRATRDPTFIQRAAVHVLGGIQPDVIRKFAPNFSGNGMLQRFLLTNMRPAERSVDRAPDETVHARWLAAIQKLASLRDNEFVPPFRFSPEADYYRRKIVAFAEGMANDPEVPPPLQGWVAKLEGEWSRLALVLHLVKWADDLFEADALFGPDFFSPGFPGEVISAETAEQAAGLLLDWQYPQQKYFYQSVLGRGTVASAHTLNVAGYILARDLRTISKRDLSRNCFGLTGATKHKARLSAMHALQLNDWVQPIPYRGTEPTKWSVNPLVHDGRFKQRADAERERREAVRNKIAEDAAERRGTAELYRAAA